MKKILCSTILATMLFVSVGSYAQNVYTQEQVKPCGNELLCTLDNVYVTGIVKVFSNGNLEKEVTYENGKKAGLGRFYYENGSLKGEGAYKDGKKEGLWKVYYENGNLKWEIVFHIELIE